MQSIAGEPDRRHQYGWQEEQSLQFQSATRLVGMHIPINDACLHLRPCSNRLEVQYFGSEGYRHLLLGAHVTSMKPTMPNGPRYGAKLVERAAEPGDGDGHRHQHQNKH